MEQARRPTLADHVHRVAPMGARVLINRTWYKSPYMKRRSQKGFGHRGTHAWRGAAERPWVAAPFFKVLHCLVLSSCEEKRTERNPPKKSPGAAARSPQRWQPSAIFVHLGATRKRHYSLFPLKSMPHAHILNYYTFRHHVRLQF
jgi:hypothetical protein